MPSEFFPARNGQTTCRIGGKQLHSSYNPQTEADRFVDSLSCNYEPEAIVLTGAGLPYAVSALKNRFPNAKYFTVQYSDDFSRYDHCWNAVFTHTGTNREQIEFEQWLASFITEENYGRILFISWKPSESCYPDAYTAVWHSIQRYIEKCRDILGTRSFFAERWIRNSVRFCRNLTYPVLLQPCHAPVVLAASGASLTATLSALAKYRERFFLAAVSSAVSTLLSAGICPDLCISTDGGYWAKKHLDILTEAHIPLAVSDESALPAILLEKNQILPLAYPDGIGKNLLAHCGIPAIHAARNGTVSGTAAELLLGLTDNKVCAVGLDLAPCTGYAHSQPNALETAASCGDTRIRTPESRQADSRYHTGALQIYRDWFDSQSAGLSARFFRGNATGRHFANTLGSISDISIEDYCSSLPEHAGKPEFVPCQIPDKTERRTRLHGYFEQILHSITDFQNPEISVWYTTAAPGEFVLFKKYNTAAHFDDVVAKTSKLLLALQERAR